MTNNPNNKNQANDILKLLSGALNKSPQTSNEVIKLLGSLSEEDLSKISMLIKSPDLQKIANSIIEAQKKE